MSSLPIVALVVGSILVLAALFFGLRGQSPTMVREFRTNLKGYSDVLNYAAIIEDGIILNKDGSLLAGWEYRGYDMDSSSNLELDALAEHANSAFKRRDAGWMMHIDAMRRPARNYPFGASFPDRTTEIIDEERRLQHQAESSHFETSYVLIFTYLPPPDASDKVSQFLVEGDKDAEDTDSGARALRTFKNAIQEFEDNLSFNLRFRRLKSRETELDGEQATVDDLLSHLNMCITGEPHDVRLPKTPMYLDFLLGSVDFYGGLKPRVGHRHIRTVAITGFPNESYPGILERLNRLPMCYRWSNRFIFLDQQDARKRLEGFRKRWAMGRKSMKTYLSESAGTGTGSGPVSGDADSMAYDAAEAMDDLSADRVRFGFYTSVIVLTDEDHNVVDQQAREVLKLLFNLGFNARVEDINAVEAFFGTHPGNGYANVRKPLVHTRTIADLIPLTSVWAGEQTNPCPFYPPNSPPLAFTATSGATPFALSLHVGDVGHTLILGPTGAGKSTLLGLITASQFRYPNAQVFIFDKGYSAYPLVTAAGGQHYDLMGEYSSPNFCPLAHVDDPSERAWAAEWLETVITLQGIYITPQHRKSIQHALLLLAESESRTMTDLLNGPLQEPALRQALDRYTLDGPLGTLIDSRSDSLRDDPFQVFELEHLMESGTNAQKNIVPVLLYLFHRIEQRLDGRPTLIVLDEAWALIDDALFAERIRDWLKTLRKKNAAVIFATQSVTDVLDKPITAAVLESCLTKIFLPNPQARSEIASEAYRKIGLTPRQIEILSYATPKRQYYYTSPNGQRLFDLGLGPIALSFVGASGKEDLIKVRELAATYGPDWPAEWLYRRGQQGAAAHWVGGTDEGEAAATVMQRYRQTWPAEWLRRHGREDAAEQWIAYYTAPANGSANGVASESQVAVS
jgi:type IV secretion/conjugal transfer VirB4 family ATPase